MRQRVIKRFRRFKLPWQIATVAIMVLAIAIPAAWAADTIFSKNVTAKGDLAVLGALTVTGAITGAGATLGNGVSLATATGALDVTRSTSGTVTITSSDDDSTAAITVDPGGNATLTLGSASDTITLGATSGIGLASGPSITTTMMSPIRFCGQGPNGTTTSYVGPVPIGSNGADYSVAAAGCDALDSTTEATADAVPFSFAYSVTGMICSITDGGTDDVLTFQARDDTANITGVTCNVTLDGSGTEVCSVDLAGVSVAAGSTVAVSAVAATDDDCSLCDIECYLFVTF